MFWDQIAGVVRRVGAQDGGVGADIAAAVGAGAVAGLLSIVGLGDSH